MYTYIILAVVAFTIAVALYVSACNIRANISIANKVCSITTTAVVKRYDTVTHSKTKDFYPVFEFVDLSGTVHTYRHKNAIEQSSLPVGKLVEFCYDPQNPMTFCVPLLEGAKTAYDLKCMSAIFAACGFVILLTMGILKLAGML